MIEQKSDVHDIAEFYITPIFRKNGYGKQFAHRIFLLYGGTWEVRQLPELEHTSRQFWLKTIRELHPASFEEFFDHPEWQGFIQRFSLKGL